MCNVPSGVKIIETMGEKMKRISEDNRLKSSFVTVENERCWKQGTEQMRVAIKTSLSLNHLSTQNGHFRYVFDDVLAGKRFPCSYVNYGAYTQLVVTDRENERKGRPASLKSPSPLTSMIF